MKRPDPVVVASDKRIAKREQEIRTRLELPANQEAFVRLGAIMGGYRADPQPAEIPALLRFITDLELMTLPEHRHGIAGALVGISGLHPELRDRWRAEAPKLFAAAEKLVPANEAEAAISCDQIEFLWMLWMTTGDAVVLRRLFKEAHRGGVAGERAAVLIAVHSSMPDVEQELLRSVEAGRTVGNAPVPLPPAQASQRKGIPQADVTALNRHVASLREGIQRAILVGWTPAQGGTFIIVTPDGQDWPECPKVWAGRPVVILKADAKQLEIHQQVQRARDEP